MKEIGAYFELDIKKKKEYHKKSIKLNSGRNTFKYILIAQNITKVYLPTYYCKCMLDPLNELNIAYEFYNVNKDFKIQQAIKLNNNEKIIYVNYFGLKNNYIKNLVNKYSKNLIVDNTHAFFEKPIKNIDTFYSPRKFFGVSDGGYLYTKSKVKNNFKLDSSTSHSLYLLGKAESNSSKYYSDFLDAENRLNYLPIRKMSQLTTKILASINYKSIAKIRHKNFKYLHKQLERYNILNIDLDTISVPLAYPFMIKNKRLRNILKQNKIYVATYWNDVFDRRESNKIEKNFVKNIIPLPIDQRYSLKDMKRITRIIKMNLKKKEN